MINEQNSSGEHRKGKSALKRRYDYNTNFTKEETKAEMEVTQLRSYLVRGWAGICQTPKHMLLTDAPWATVINAGGHVWLIFAVLVPELDDTHVPMNENYKRLGSIPCMAVSLSLSLSTG